ncbi:hypothetical protein PS1_013615 [Malus domestica]
MCQENSVNQEVDNTITSQPEKLLKVDINPNQRLNSVLLYKFNYLPWSRVVTLALGGRNKLGFIHGNVPAPKNTSSNYEGWLCKNQLVIAWLLNSMERKIAQIFNYSKSSLLLWTTVKEMYGNQNNSAHVFQLKRDMSVIQQESKSFIQHLGSLKSMWNKLDVYMSHTTDSTVLLKMDEKDKIF